MKKTILTSIASALVVSSVHATPTIYPKDLTLLSSVENTTNSNLVADDSDLKVIWVMPPNTASSKVNGLHTITSNVGFCKEMADLQSYSRSMSEKMKALQLQEVESEEELKVIRERISRARQEAADFIVSNNLHNVDQIDDRLILVEDQIAGLNDSASSCEQDCQEISAQLKELRAERVDLVSERRELSKNRVKSVREMAKKKAAVGGLEKDYQDAEERWGKVIAKLDDLRSRFITMYSTFGNMEGARASISFESNWDSNIEELARLNPGFDFKRILTQNAVITTNLIGSGALPGNNAILGYEIAGNYSEGKITFPSYPQSMAGNIRLSLIGTCPVLYPELFSINLPTGTDSMKYGMVVSYEFPSSFEMDVTATYNMYKMYQKIVSSGKKGGFFRSKKWSSVEEKNFFKDEFKVSWNEQDQANSLTEEQRADYEKELRDSMFGRLAAIGLPSVPNAGNLVAGDAGPTGAAVLASSLSKNAACKVNKWCVAASIGINVLDSIFGNSSSSSSYKNIQDVDMTERWSRKQVVYKPWISTYR